MKLRQCFLSLFVLVSLAGPLAAIDVVTETWRSPWGAPAAVAVNPTDSSVWAALGSTVVHLSADGTLLWRGTNFWAPGCVALNTADGSCWVADSNRNQVVHLGAAGQELWRGGGFVHPVEVAVNPGDGSVWVAQNGSNFAIPEVTGEAEVIHLAADGTVFWRTSAYGAAALAVSPADGACWVRDYDGLRLVRLSPSGEETTSLATPNPDGQIGVGLADGSVWASGPDNQQVVHLSASGEQLASVDMPGASDVAVNPEDGSLWVFAPTPPSPTTPRGAYDLVHLAADGAELWRRGGFHDPWGGGVTLAANPADGSVWVANRDLIRLDADGTETFRSRGFADPVSVAVNTADHTVWVADQGRSRLAQLDAAGQEVGAITGCWPTGLAVNPTDGSTWELDGEATITHFGRDGAVLWQQSDPSGSVHAVAVNPDDSSGWVGFFDAVIHYSAHGEELWRGTGFEEIRALAVDRADGSCWVAFASGSDGIHIAHLAADGRQLWRSADGAFGQSWSMGVDPRDRSVRIAEYGPGIVTSLSREGEVLWRTEVGAVPRSVAVNPADGSCWVGIFGGSSVALLSAEGVVLWRGTGFSLPGGVSLDPDTGICWVADTADSQVVRLDRFQFTDVPFTHWASDAIYECVAAGIVGGYGGGGYRPDLEVTRDQMAVYFARALAGGDASVPTGPATPSFTDVDTNHWAYRYIEYCGGRGVVQGYWNDTYHPDEVVDRAQMAVYIARAIADPVGEAGLVGYEAPSAATFSDVPTDHWAYRYVEYAAAHGIVQGVSGRYVPDLPVTRDQMAVFVARAFLEK